jgi:hypothetical protein
MANKIHVAVFWVVMPWIDFLWYQSFGGLYCFHLLGEVKVDAERSSVTSVSYHITRRRHNAKFHDLKLTLCCFIWQNAKDPVLKQLYKQFIAPNKDSTPRSSMQGLLRACSDSQYVFIHSLDTFQKNAANLTCQLTPVPHAKVETLKSMAMVKGSPYLGLFRYVWVMLMLINWPKA